MAVILACSKLHAQQQFVFTNYLLNQYYYNPALAGSENVHRANVGYRNQWTGFDGAPLTLHANFYGSLKNKMKHGYGVSFMSDRSGLVQNINVNLNYAYHLRVTDSIRLGFGVRPGYQQYNIKLYDAQLADSGDDILTGNILSMNAVNLDAGLYLYSNKFYVSLSMRHMLGKIVSFTGYNQNLSKHFTLIGGYNFRNKKKTLEFQPSLMLQYVSPAPPQLSVMMKATYKKKYFGGLVYRTQDALAIVAGINLFNRWTIGYAYGFSLGGVRSYNYGTHELMISFITTKNKPSLEEEDEELNNGIFEENKEKNKE